MRVERLPPDTARRITPAALRQHAEALGWQLVPGVNGTIVVYAHPSNPLHQVIVPLEARFRDYPDRVSEAVAGFAEAEGRTVPDVAEQLLFPRCDLLRFHVGGADGEHKPLSLNDAAQMLNGLTALLLGAADLVALAPGLSSAAIRFVGGCQFGHSLPGGFGFTLACPLDLDADGAGPDVTPFARRVTTTLMGSLRDLIRAADAGDLASLLDQESPVRLNLRFLEAVASLRSGDPWAVIDLSVAWSEMLPADPSSGEPVRFTRAVFDAVDQIVVQLHSTARTASLQVKPKAGKKKVRPDRTGPRNSAE